MKASSRNSRSKDHPGTVIKYRPQGRTLAKFHADPSFVRIVIGPLGSAKTMSAIHDMLHAGHTQTPNRHHVRKSRWCVARNSFPDLNSSTIPDFRSITDKLPYGTFTNGAPPKWKVEYPRADGTRVEMEVLFRSFDGPQDQAKARGMQLTGVWVDELGEFDKTNFDMLIGRVKRFPPKHEVPKAKFHVIGTSNAVSRDHWLADYALKHTPPGWWIGIQPPAVSKVGGEWVVNPEAENLHNLADTYYDGQIGGKKESWIRQNLANEFIHHTDNRPIHPDFNEVIHVADLKAAHGLPLQLGMDWGRTPACIIMQRQPNGAWYGLREICLTNCGADKLGKRVKTVLNQEYSGFMVEVATGDPSGSSGGQQIDASCFDLFEEHSDLDAFPADTNDPDLRYATLDNLLTTLIDGLPAIIFDRQGCEMAIRGMAGEYCFRRLQVAGEERYKDNPDKGPTSHIVEAIHYGLMGAGETTAMFSSNWSENYGDMEWTVPMEAYE